VALAVWQDQEQLPWEMLIVRHHFGLILARDFARELSSGKISSASALDKFIESEDCLSRMDKRAPCRADLASLKDKKHFQAYSEDHSTNRVPAP